MFVQVPSEPAKLIFDANIWVSFAIGKRLGEVERVLKSVHTEVFVCDKLLREVYSTLSKPKLQSYVSVERRNILLQYMVGCSSALITEQTARTRDAKDDYLLDLAQLVGADFLVTGDNDLLVLGEHYQTKILTFSDFMVSNGTIL